MYLKRKTDGKIFKVLSKQETETGTLLYNLKNTAFQLINDSSKEKLAILVSKESMLRDEFEEVWLNEGFFTKLLKKKQYNFLRQNPNLNTNIVLITKGGSHAYGTNIETSDVDIRAISYCPYIHNLGIEGLGPKYKDFEVYCDKNTDSVVYSLNKFISLCLKCNPNIIEMLGCREEDYIYLDSIGKKILENKKLFLSQYAIYSFGGYATSQLRRLENAVAHDKLTKEQKEIHISNSVNNAIYSFKDQFKKLKKKYNIRAHVGKIKNQDEKQILIDIKLKNYPMRELNGMCQQMTSIAREYDKLNHRNNKKDDEHLNKHAMHLVRLYLMCFDICEKQEINTYREKDIDLLLSIRKGLYQNEDGTFKKEFFEMIEKFDTMLNGFKSNSSLPEHPDVDAIAKLFLEIKEQKEG